MKPKNYLIITTLLILSVLISACSSTVYSSTGWHGLAASQDTAYLAAGTQVFAVDLNTGSEKWRYPAKANSKINFYANPVLTPDGQQLLNPSYDHHLYSLNPANGSLLWTFSGSTNRLIGSPLVADNMIFQPSSDHYIYAISMNGIEAWKAKTGDPIWATPATDPNCGCIYVASMDHMVYSFNASNGQLLWKSPDLGGALVGTPAVSTDGVLFIGTYGKEMIALDATNGNIKWRFTTQDRIWAGPALENNILYFGDLSGYLYALNASDGSTNWRIQPQNSIVDTPVVTGDNLYFTTESDMLYIVSTSGNIVSSKQIGGQIYSAPVIVGEIVLVTPTNYTALLVALNLDGNPKWTFTPAK